MKKNDSTLRFINFKRQTISDFLNKKGFSDKNIYYLIKNKNIIIKEGRIITSKWHVIKPFCKIAVSLNEKTSYLPLLKKELEIVYEDEFLMIVNKPFNLDIEPTRANYENNLVAMINYYFKTNGISSNVHLINRLDKLTSGLVIVGKSRYIHHLFSKTKIIKKYEALVSGKTKKRRTVKIRLKKQEGSIKREISEDGKVCISKFRRIKFDGTNSLVSIRIYTGRTHQIRASFASINHPLVGDYLYGNTNEWQKMYLKAVFLKFKHPITSKIVKVKIK